MRYRSSLLVGKCMYKLFQDRVVSQLAPPAPTRLIAPHRDQSRDQAHTRHIHSPSRLQRMRVKMDETSSLSMRHCTSAASIAPLSGFSTARVTDCADMLATMGLLTHACSPAYRGTRLRTSLQQSPWGCHLLMPRQYLFCLVFKLCIHKHVLPCLHCLVQTSLC